MNEPHDKMEAFQYNAWKIRDLATRTIAVGAWGHIGGCYSLAEILSVLFQGAAVLNPENPDDENRDIVILSKAHASPALYAAMTVAGVFPEDTLYTYCREGGLEGHLDQLRTPGVEMSGGSLGIGLSYAVGVALALKKQEQFHRRVYCIVGDGELCEGEIWEGMMSASQFHLDNLILIVDYNKVMAKGFLYEQMSMEPLAERITAFGWHALEIDGHDPAAISDALYRAKYICVTGKPVCVLAHTVKGRGVARCEFNYRWHTHAPDVETANEFLQELALNARQPFEPIRQTPRAVCGLDALVNGKEAGR